MSQNSINMWTVNNQTSYNRLDNNGDLRIEFSPHLPHEMASIQSNRTSNLQMQLTEQFEQFKEFQQHIKKEKTQYEHLQYLHNMQM
jgi:hypothetical protein